MPKLPRATVYDASLGARAPYIYGILVKLEHADILYIGQTFSRFGAIGRLAQHLSDTSAATLCRRVEALLDVVELAGIEVEFAAVRLGNQTGFWKQEPDYREAVEATVQHELLNELAIRGARIGIVSRVQPNAYCQLKYVQDEAARTTQSLLEWISNTRPTSDSAAASG